MTQKPLVGQGPLIIHTRYESPERVISLSQRPLPDNTQHLKQTNSHAPLAVFEPAIRASERPQTHALDRYGIRIGDSDV